MTAITKTAPIRKFIDTQTRKVSKAWISNSALYEMFVRWMTWDPRLIESVKKFISYQCFARSLGHDLKIPTVRRWIEGRQVYGRHLWPLESIRKSLNFGVDFI